MVNARPGFWDVDRCTWVGADPMYVVPPAPTGDHAPDRVLEEVHVDVPEPRPPVEHGRTTLPTP